LYFGADEATIVARLSGRRLCRSCGANYHVKFMPPKNGRRCDKCGGELYQRSDDRAETIRERLQVYHKQTEGLIGYYRSKGLLREIAGDASVEQVAREVRKALSAVGAHRV
jgi:adenylate kinase